MANIDDILFEDVEKQQDIHEGNALSLTHIGLSINKDEFLNFANILSNMS